MKVSEALKNILFSPGLAELLTTEVRHAVGNEMQILIIKNKDNKEVVRALLELKTRLFGDVTDEPAA